MGKFRRENLYKPAPEDLHLGMHDDPDGAVLLHLGQLLFELLIDPLGAGMFLSNLN